MTVGEVARQHGERLTCAQALPPPKAMISAGSNGRYSRDCAALAAVLERPCVNASIGMGIGLGFHPDHAHARGVRVIGGLPTVPDTVPVQGADVVALRR